MNITPEAETVEIRDASGNLLREMRVETDKPDPEMYGQFQIDHEPSPLPLNYAIAQLHREEQIMREVRRVVARNAKAKKDQ